MEYQFILVMGGMVGTAIAGAIWVGKLMNQIAINTERLNTIEKFDSQVSTHDAETTERWRMIDYRLDRIEKYLNGPLGKK